MVYQVNFTRPHDPWDVTESMKKRWADVDFPKPNNYEDNDDDVIGIRQNYAAMLENIDRICGEIIKEADSRGELDNTYFIYASDHGEMLGDSNKYGKSVPGRASLHVPLVISGRDVLKGKVNNSLVELQDLASTVLDLCGITDSFTSDSISLKSALFDGKDIGRTIQTSSLTPPRECNWKIVKNRRAKIVLYSGEIKEVYDTENDIWENNNLFISDKDRAMRLISEFLQEL